MHRALLVLLTAAACQMPGLEPGGEADTTPLFEDNAPARPDNKPFNPGRVPLPEADRATVCADDCLLLTRYDLHTVKHRFPELCCGPDGTPDDPRCETGWLPDPVPCERWAELQSCVLARYGHVFEDKTWSDRFAAEPWYTPDPSFTTGDMAVIAKRNTTTLLRMYADKTDCVAE